MTLVIVERVFERPLAPEEVAHLFRRLGPCLDAHDVRWVESHLSRDRTRMFCAFEADDVEAVRQAHRSGGIGFVAIWPCDRLRPRGDAARS